MAQQAEARDIRGRMDSKLQRNFAGVAIEHAHGFYGRPSRELARAVLLDGGADDPCAQALRENQLVSGLRRGVGKHTLRVNQPRNGIAELDFLVADAVPADHRAARLPHLGKPAQKNVLKDAEVVSAVWETNYREGGNGAAAHGVDVAQRVCSGNLTEGVRVIDDGRKEIHGL